MLCENTKLKQKLVTSGEEQAYQDAKFHRNTTTEQTDEQTDEQRDIQKPKT